MSFANISLKENNSDIIYKIILEKIDKSLIELEFDEIDYYASDEEINRRKKKQIYKLLKIN